MAYFYLAFGIPVISEIELPALFPLKDITAPENPLYVRLGMVPAELANQGQRPDRNAYCNANEMIYTVSGKIKFYIYNGSEIVIEPIDPDYRAHLIYFYSNGLASALYQRTIIPFHVSGVFTHAGKVALFAAPSGTGKSTLAVKLQEMGYQPFTDDTAILYLKEGKCFAQASYPMIRLWEQTIDQQSLLNTNDKQKIFDDGEKDKFGFAFHEKFNTNAVEVAKIIFVTKEETEEVGTRPITKVEAFKMLSDNVYRNHWIPAMQKSLAQFKLVSGILNTIPFTHLIRPEASDSFSSFPLFVKNILPCSDN